MKSKKIIICFLSIGFIIVGSSAYFNKTNTKTPRTNQTKLTSIEGSDDVDVAADISYSLSV